MGNYDIFIYIYIDIYRERALCPRKKNFPYQATLSYGFNSSQGNVSKKAVPNYTTSLEVFVSFNHNLSWNNVSQKIV